MAKEILPKQYLQIKKRHEKYFNAVENWARLLSRKVPLDERTAHLIQLAAAATVHSEGAVHSHVRRAIDAGVTPEEIYHAIILLTSTIGFPTVVAALSWAEDVIKAKRNRVFLRIYHTFLLKCCSRSILDVQEFQSCPQMKLGENGE